MDVSPDIGPLSDRYLLIERLGADSVSVQWRGQDTVADREVSVRMLATLWSASPTYRAAMRQRATVATRLDHPRLARVYEYGEHVTPDGQLVAYLVTELVAGRPLADRLADGPLPWREAVEVCAQAADAVVAAQHGGIVGCDVTPENVLLTSAGVKVIAVGDASLTMSPHRAGAAAHRGAYRPPESLPGHEPGPRSDSYRLGVLLHECLTGSPPPLSSAAAGARAAGMPQVPGLPSELNLPDAVIDVHRRCQDPDPGSRPSPGSVAEILHDAVRPRSAASTPRVLPVPGSHRLAQAPRPVPGRWLIAVTAAILAVTAGAAGWAMWRIGGDTGPPVSGAVTAPAARPSLSAGAPPADPSDPATRSPGAFAVVDLAVDTRQCGADRWTARATLRVVGGTPAEVTVTYGWDGSAPATSPARQAGTEWTAVLPGLPKGPQVSVRATARDGNGSTALSDPVMVTTRTC